MILIQVERNRALSKNEQVSLDVISAEVDQIESSLKSTYILIPLKDTCVEAKADNKDSFKTKMFRFRAAQ